MKKGFGEMSMRSLACPASLMSRKMTEKPRMANIILKIERMMIDMTHDIHSMHSRNLAVRIHL